MPDTAPPPDPRRANRRVLRVAAGALVLGTFFVWGFFTHRNRIFPYPLLRNTERLRLEVDDADNLLDPLAGVPYVAGTLDPDSDRKGVLVLDEERTDPGFNLWCNRYTDQAFLMDMRGNVVHEWRHESADWTHVAVLPDGGLLGLARDARVLRLDVDSQVLWTFETRAHHDLWVRPDGTIYVLSRRAEVVPRVHPTVETVVDDVVVLSPDGREIRRFSILDAVLDSPHAGVLPSVAHRDFDSRDLELDVLHANHVEVFDGSLADRSPLYAEGNVLVSLRVPNAVIVLDPTGREILWLWGPNTLQRQHHPSLLENGDILIFDNRLEASRVVEVDPLTNRIVWSWEPGPGFFSLSRGSAQRLPNGNTLVTESDRGYVHEVTADGEVVWQFANPDVTLGGERYAIWRMQRLTADDVPFLGR